MLYLESAPDKHVLGPFPPLCRGPLAQKLPIESATLTKNGEAQDKLTVQFMLFMSELVILKGG